MPRCTARSLIEAGIKVADSKIFQEDKIWARYSNDKVDIGEGLVRVIRTLDKAMPLSRPMRALSVGSSDEPQLRILETAFRDGLYLLDLEKEALDIVRERIRRQYTSHVITVLGDYKKAFLDSVKADLFLKNRLGGRKVNLITLHHSLYYCGETLWRTILRNLYQRILTPRGAIHIVLMAAKSDDEYTTAWLYNHFVGKFFACRNDQDLHRLKRELKADRVFKEAQILSKTSLVRFFVNDFEKFMAVIWMILLYPDVHNYSAGQKKEITEFVYKKFWEKKRPLIQRQDHLAIYRGIGFRGLI